jgi:hypothetical protein
MKENNLINRRKFLTKGLKAGAALGSVTKLKLQ